MNEFFSSIRFSAVCDKDWCSDLLFLLPLSFHETYRIIAIHILCMACCVSCSACLSHSLLLPHFFWFCFVGFFSHHWKFNSCLLKKNYQGYQVERYPKIIINPGLVILFLQICISHSYYLNEEQKCYGNYE